MDIKLALFILCLGIIIGLVLAAKMGIGATNISNDIDKIKTTGDASTVNADLTQNIQPKKGFLKRIFKRKT